MSTENTRLHHVLFPPNICISNMEPKTKMQPLQDKALRVTNLKPNNHDVADLCKNDPILKVLDYIKMLNCFFVRDVLTSLTIPSFQNYLNKSEKLQQHNTRHGKQNSVTLTQRSTDYNGIKSIPHQPALVWKKLQNKTNHDILQEFPSKTKEYNTNKTLNSY